MNLGVTIKNRRKHKDLSQDQLAVKCGITQTYLSQIENNQKDPSLVILKKMATVLGIPLPVLFFQSMTEEDIQHGKRDVYKVLGPAIKNIINEIFFV
jgi:XRE family transcriptional regulator, regulator of sulfur utilization